MASLLTIRIHNTGEGSNESAKYEYWVFVNNQEIERGEIHGHNRNDGWAALVKSIAERHLTTRAADVRRRRSSVCRKCGWWGTVGEMEPDVDGEGSLGCPYCGSVIPVIAPNYSV